MNKRISKIIVAISSHKIELAETGVSEFMRGMTAIEPNFMNRETLDKRLSRDKVVMFVGKSGKVYHIYKYENPASQ